MPIVDYLAVAAPEVILAIAGMAFLMVGVFRGDGSTRLLSSAAIVLFLLLALKILQQPPDRALAFGGAFVIDGFSGFMKILVLLGSAMALTLSVSFVEREQMARFEYPVLITFATLGMLMMVSANDLLSLYVGLELQSLSLYVLAAFRRDALRASEAGLKYFVLGALSSGMLLYGASLVYGFVGTTNFDGIAAMLLETGTVVEGANIGIIVGLIFVMAALAFKISAVPFHMWTPDVYEGAPTPVTAFFSLAPKIAAFALFTRLLIGPFLEMTDQWRQVIVVIAIASMVFGSFAAIAQSNIKRLMAYSSIAHMGFALLGLAAGNEAGVTGIAAYLAIYLVMTTGTFAIILCMRQGGRAVEDIIDLSGLAKSQPAMAAAMAIFMFSMAGIPPTAGFFGKLMVFQAAVSAELYFLAIIGVLASVVGAYYYLRIIKIMYFDEVAEPLDKPVPMEMSLVLLGTAGVTLLFFAFPGLIINGAEVAAAALFTGL